ncbi:hypothetical protein [Streptomyces hoynatensis]|uniref:DUF3558 domain-containing protein n=1 Tax=Streptomyces hoynatensis TaxID=1141874 RepID=A0A3A9ZET5_9ACTN|nr:hypothetical protein [Streptomyces hoynatensis]RKN45786.1 hypothetical protein D7294_04845 [Streptomyces hoynatensis]
MPKLPPARDLRTRTAAAALLPALALATTVACRAPGEPSAEELRDRATAPGTGEVRARALDAVQAELDEVTQSLPELHRYTVVVRDLCLRGQGWDYELQDAPGPALECSVRATAYFGTDEDMPALLRRIAEALPDYAEAAQEELEGWGRAPSAGHLPWEGGIPGVEWETPEGGLIDDPYPCQDESDGIIYSRCTPDAPEEVPLDEIRGAHESVLTWSSSENYLTVPRND